MLNENFFHFSNLFQGSYFCDLQSFAASKKDYNTNDYLEPTFHTKGLLNLFNSYCCSLFTMVIFFRRIWRQLNMYTGYLSFSRSFLLTRLRRIYCTGIIQLLCLVDLSLDKDIDVYFKSLCRDVEHSIPPGLETDNDEILSPSIMLGNLQSLLKL